MAAGLVRDFQDAEDKPLTMPSQLGAETIDMIIDHLHDDRLALQACSVTCKKWLPSSRYHLFSKVLLSPFNVDKFRKLIETTCYDIASIPWHLTLSGFNAYICWHEGIDITAANEHLHRVSVRLRGVTFLRVERSEGVNSRILSRWSKIQELEMVNMGLSGMDDAFKLVHEFPELQTLSMENISWNSCMISRRDYTQRTQRPSFVLRNMKLEGAAFTDVTNWLLCLSPTPAVRTLHCDSYDPVTSLSRDVLLQSVGHSVHSLHLHLRNRPTGVEEAIHLVDISPCTNLRALYLMDIPTHMVYSGWLLDILIQIISTDLEELVLDFSTPDSGSSWVRSFDRVGVACLLADTKFSKLRVLRIDCRSRVGFIRNLEYIVERRVDPEVEKSISEGAFSDLNRRGILQFIHT